MGVFGGPSQVNEADSDMDLTTRCPRCGMVFEAGLQELQLRKGYIRCVQCAHIFDGYAEVVSDSASTIHDAPKPQAHTPAEPEFIEHIVSDDVPPSVFRPPRQEPRFTVGDQGDDTVWQPDRGRPDPRVPADSDRSFVVEAHPTRGQPYGGSAAPLLRQHEGGLFQQLGRWSLNLLVVFGLVLLLAQFAYVYRSQIALAVPSMRPALENACAALRCEVPYARDVSQLIFTGSDLKRDTNLDPSSYSDSGAQHFILSLTLRNRGAQPSMWPNLVLDLNDSSGARVVRRNLSPRDYLPPAQLGRPFPADSEVLVQVPLAVNGVRVIGFELDLFFS